jgi:hypothetical protein
VDHPSEGKQDVPKAFSAAISAVKKFDGPVGSNKGKLLMRASLPLPHCSGYRREDREGQMHKLEHFYVQ